LLDALHEPDARGYPTEAFVESDREALFGMELLRMFKQRIRLVCLLGILVVPAFAGFYWYLSPNTFEGVAQFCGLMVLALLTICFLSVPVSTLPSARLLSFAGYGLLSVGVAVVINVVSQDASRTPANSAIQFTILASYVHILLSILLMPFSFWEAFITVTLMTVGIGWGLRQAAPNEYSPALAAQAFVLVSAAAIVLYIAHLQNVLRRRAFDSAFDLARQAAQMQEVSATDALTGGYNRRHMEETLATELTRAARFHRPLSLIMFDLDNFKPVNDTLGHAAGDEVLREIHRAAQQVLREVDSLARFGGDEFLAILPETDLASARAVAQRLRNATSAGLRDRFGAQALESRVTLSMGVLTIQESEPMAVIEAVSRVDALLYEAKRGGKNRISAGE
jgi:diguanylate cyclase (GGDEF)-like protein